MFDLSLLFQALEKEIVDTNDTEKTSVTSEPLNQSGKCSEKLKNVLLEEVERRAAEKGNAKQFSHID